MHFQFLYSQFINMNDSLNSISIKMKNNILDQSQCDFSASTPDELKLNDQILIYNDGTNWKIIPLKICLMHPIIYDTYDNNEQTFPITIIVCPVTLISVVVKGTFAFDSYNGTTMILKDKNDNIMPIDVGYKIDSKYIIYQNKRSDAKLMVLRDAIMFAPDALILKLKTKQIKPIISAEYYTNEMDLSGNTLNTLIHPKTLVYVIQYKSNKTNNEKTSIILGKDSQKDFVTGFNLKSSGVTSYFIKKQHKIIHEEGFLLPILWYVSKEMYPSAKIVYLY